MLDIDDLTDVFAMSMIISGQVKLSQTKGQAGRDKGQHLFETAYNLAEGYIRGYEKSFEPAAPKQSKVKDKKDYVDIDKKEATDANTA